MLKRVALHQFRHIRSSLLNDLKVPVKIAQEQLGHASIATTLNIYTHVVDASHRKAVEAVEERLFVELDPNGPKWAIVPRTSSPASGVVVRVWLASRSAQLNKDSPPSPKATAGYLRLDLARRLEAPPGFEPGMEVLQTKRERLCG